MVLPIAHQGGWDEALIFAVPVLLYAAIRLWDRRRGDDEVADSAADPEGDEPARADRQPEAGG